MITDIGAPASTAGAAGTQKKAAAITSDFETFLKMLTAQARYQDPLKPIDSTEYAAQLAQFSMVEQQVQTNDTLTALFAHLGLQNPASLAAWVGMEARATTPMRFDGTPITVAPEPAATADLAYLVVRGVNRQVVQRIQIPVSETPVEWVGIDDNGSPFPPGEYSFEVECWKGGEVLQTDPAAIYARVTEAQIDGGEVVLILAGGQAVSASAVTALREPS